MSVSTIHSKGDVLLTIALTDALTGELVSDATVTVELTDSAGASVATATAAYDADEEVYYATLGYADLASISGRGYTLAITATSATSGRGYGAEPVVARPQEL